MQVFPAAFPMEGKNVLIIGGSEEARRKARLFSKTPANIFAFSNDFDTAYLDEFSEKISFLRRMPVGDDFMGASLCVIALSDRDEAERYSRLAKANGVSVNVVDQPDLCDWYTPSIIDRDDLVVSISTNGAAPVIGRMIREQIEVSLPKGAGLLVSVAKKLRDEVARKFKSSKEPRYFWERALNGKAADLANVGDAVQVEIEIRKQITEDNNESGVVHLVGAGPGASDLITMRGFRVLQQADVVFYDALVSEDVLNLVRRDSDRIYVGKRSSHHVLPQDEIIQQLIDAARDGKRVVRLKGGDPFIFGRGGEELDALKAKGIRVFVIPGITAAIGCAASANIPLTHRDAAQSVTFVTGHGKSGGPESDWRGLAQPNHTLSFYMGRGNAEKIARNLISHGRSPNTPVALILNGTLQNEQVLRGRLRALPRMAKQCQNNGPALLIIGEVAATSIPKSQSKLIQELVL